MAPRTATKPGTRDDDARMVTRVAYALERIIQDGTYPPHSRMAPERELAKRYGVKRHIIRRAIGTLADKGLLYRLERGGTFVHQPAASGDVQTHEGADIVRQDAGHTQPTTLKAVTFIEHHWPYVPEFLQSILLEGYSRVLEHHALRIRFMLEPEDPARFDDALLPALPPRMQGCILGNIRSPELVHWLFTRQVPFVIRFGRVYDRQSLPPHHSVLVNRGVAGLIATRHLLELGHRQIGFLGWLPGQATEMMYDGYLAALSLHGLQPRPNHLAEVPGTSIANSLDAARTVLRQPDRPSAIVAQNDVIALAALQVAGELGLRVPQDLSITGYDDRVEAQQCNPPLTTFHNPIADLAATSLELLIEVAAGVHNEWQHRVLEPRFIVRGSTASRS